MTIKKSVSRILRLQQTLAVVFHLLFTSHLFFLLICGVTSILWRMNTGMRRLRNMPLSWESIRRIEWYPTRSQITFKKTKKI